MDANVLLAMLLVGGGLAAISIGFVARAYAREEQLAEILDLPYGEHDVDIKAAIQEHPSLVETTIGLAGKAVDSFDAKGALLGRLERSRIPLRPGEFVIVVAAVGLALATFVAAITSRWLLGGIVLIAMPFVAKAFLDSRIQRRRKKFEQQFPDALTLIASSLSAGHTFLRSIQLMCHESEQPLAEEFARVVHETQLGDPLVDALDRMADRLDLRDVAWVVQAIRIQQDVGGHLAELLHTLADFIRGREEVRREVNVLTAEGRISAYVLAALPPLLLLLFAVINPTYMTPLFRGWGFFFMGLSALSVAAGLSTILRMVKGIEL